LQEIPFEALASADILMQIAAIMARPPAWKYRELVTALGGDDVVASLIRAEGFEPPALKTITAWRQRNSVPGNWAPLLIDVALRKGLLDRVSQLRRKVDTRGPATDRYAVRPSKAEVVTQRLEEGLAFRRMHRDPPKKSKPET
jgi:hypothetical protein